MSTNVTCTNCGGPCSSQNEFLDWICDAYAVAGRCSPPAPVDPVARLRGILEKVDARATELRDRSVDDLVADVQRYRRALLAVVACDTYARHGAAHAQVSRAVRIARAALNGEDPTT